MVFFRTIKKEGEPVQTKGEVEKEGKVSLIKMKATERSTIGLPRGGRPARGVWCKPLFACTPFAEHATRLPELSG